MKFAVVFAALFAVAFAAPQNPSDVQATVVSQDAQIAPDHSSYQFASRTSNGISASEQGSLVQPKSADETAAYATQGEFSWTAPDGQQFTLRYTADATGFHPEAAHLPVAPVA